MGGPQGRALLDDPIGEPCGRTLLEIPSRTLMGEPYWRTLRWISKPCHIVVDKDRLVALAALWTLGLYSKLPWARGASRRQLTTWVQG